MKNKDQENNTIPAAEGFCPNCWGYQEYQDQLKEAAEKVKIDLNNVLKHKGWIQAYAEKNLLGIKLIANQKPEGCPTCK